ncbi:type II toxin-antitoxin system VapC family toxin [Halocatena pleomorpha]|uniref:Type II toxin-antitoxin system VapC family toxin n=1 Tax=Halocatena pleomorpha TaxID=1785090 RepID=A0A3P3RJI8_9EURY|nr:type II toxin-antitoxin system VapC family toxin [Halocatena pleomorpha]
MVYDSFRLNASPKIRRELADIPVTPFDGDAAEEAATIHATLADRGNLINKLDILIAGTARHQDATVVAAGRDFDRVPELDVHNPKTV